uniref:NADH-ubiquinone oxidoreductase chain 2 n=2 Tax=unclassified Platycephalus TaxID=2634724 RepID=A0A8B0R743_9TELE|nr:NADH dehydrogenase subunit 2 [Platycephalus sp. 1 JJX-2020]QTW90961.1 NADH dehydrogenase subunit 2 [Platycephalus sp. 1 SX-2021]UBY46704.1 NADH dehydrogenase subunit 2 [Platycephalus sp. 1 SX-2021]UBY46717.1 NADH dehydrogenase subunit 2 [Platycephalus sp. 1 SX-2021]
MSPLTLTLIAFSLGLGTTLTFAGSHWFLAWMGLEISTLAIIPLMAQHHHPRAVEATIKYFLTQATGAALLLFAALTNAWLMGMWETKQLDHPISVVLLTVALALKMGLAPTHLWLPEVMQGLDLTTALILSTWQKLAPFALLTQVYYFNPEILVTIGLLSTILGGWGGLNQTQLRKILAYSSIAHLGWMVLVMQFSPSLALLALLSYMIMTTSTFLVFKLGAATNINTLASSWAKAPALTALAPLLLLSLGGLPPLTGFMPKWLILQELTKQGLAPTATLAALSALLSLYFYLRLSYAMALTIPPNTPTGTTPWRFPPIQLTLPLAISATATLALLPLTPAIITLLNL